MARALFTDWDTRRPAERNYARWMFLDAAARSLFVDWDVQARAAVEGLRLDAGTDPRDRATAALVAELRAGSTEFARWWDEHRVYQRTHGSKRLRHPLVGDLTVEYETLTLPGDPDIALFFYTTEPDSPSRHALDMLVSWTLTALPGTSGCERTGARTRSG